MSTKRDTSSNGKVQHKSSMAEANGRVPVLKTYKMYIGGAFVRSESEREYPVVGSKQKLVAHVCRGTRKDIRNAVVAAHKGFAVWKSRTAYNRAQIIYRMAEMLESRRDQFEKELILLGATKKQAIAETGAAIDCIVHYAGWADKFQQVLGSINPVAGNFFNFSCAEPIGVVGVVAPESSALLGLVRALAPAVCAGNAVIVLLSERSATVGLSFAEVLASSDVPAGVVNLLSGLKDELLTPLGSHMDIGAVCLPREERDDIALVRALGGENLKRVVAQSAQADSLTELESMLEIKTTWHPVAV